MTGAGWVYQLPSVNASLNALAGCFLLLGWNAIKKGRMAIHRWWMLCAFCASTLFLVSYLTYHISVPGVTKYPGTGLSRGIYFFILLTHTPLAVLIVPFSLIALWHAWHGNFKAHTKITRWLFPVWGYVSVTGVLIYLMLYVWR